MSENKVNSSIYKPHHILRFSVKYQTQILFLKSFVFLNDVIQKRGCNIATINPFRYRGYYYDTETDLYYLQSRYYNPEIGRFINADEAEFIGSEQDVWSLNLFQYAQNSPVYNDDELGSISAKSIADFLKKVLKVINQICDFVLKKFNISARNYKNRNKYNNKKDIYNLVFKNKDKIKKIKNTSKDIAFS